MPKVKTDKVVSEDQKSRHTTIINRTCSATGDVSQVEVALEDLTLDELAKQVSERNTNLQDQARMIQNNYAESTNKVQNES